MPEQSYVIVENVTLPGAIAGLADLEAKLGLVGASRAVGKLFSGSRVRLQTSATIELFANGKD